jgi:Protein of unknown function (DUF992)
VSPCSSLSATGGLPAPWSWQCRHFSPGSCAAHAQPWRGGLNNGLSEGQEHRNVGSDRTVALQPVFMQAHTGVNIAAGVEAAIGDGSSASVSYVDFRLDRRTGQ